MACTKALKQETIWCDQQREGQYSRGEGRYDWPLPTSGTVMLGPHSGCTGGSWRVLNRAGLWQALKACSKQGEPEFISTGFILFHSFSGRHFTSFL